MVEFSESGSKAFSGQSALIPTLTGLLQEPLNVDSLQSLLAVVANLAAAGLSHGVFSNVPLVNHEIFRIRLERDSA